MNSQRDELLTGYVLGVLEPSEMHEVERMAATDAAVRAAIQSLHAHVHQLGHIASPVQPAPQVKQQLLARVAASRPQPAAARRRASSRTLALGWVTALLLVIGMGSWNVSLRQQNTRLNTDNAALTTELRAVQETNAVLAQDAEAGKVAIAFMTSSGTTSRVLSATSSAPAAHGTMYMQPGNTQAVLVVDGLQPLPADKQYQFWLAQEGHEPVPSNTFKVDANGHVQLVIKAAAQVNDYQQVMITIEPVGGSLQPGSTTVLEGNL